MRKLARSLLPRALLLVVSLLGVASAAAALDLAGLGHSYVRISSLVGGVLLTGIGVLLLFRPEWLPFS